MKNQHWFVLTLALTFAAPAAARAEQSDELELTLEEALELASTQGPDVVLARKEIEVARSDVRGADIVSPFNPTLSGAAGPRFSPDGDVSPNISVSLGQTFEVGGRRKARVEAAEADVTSTRHLARDAARRHLEQVATAYLYGIHARRRLDISLKSLTLAEAFVEVARERFEAGETNRLEVNSAELARGKHQVEVEVWEGRLSRRRGNLEILLGLEPSVRVVFATELSEHEPGQLAELIASAHQRGDIQAVDAQLRREQARMALADALGWPDVGVSVRYAREEGADIAMGGLSITLPVFARGQGEAAAATAQSALLSERLDALRREAETEVRTAYERHRTLRDATKAFRERVLPILEQNEQMVSDAYRAGAVDLPDLLALQREVIEAREAYADLLLEAELARVRIRAAAGSLPGRGARHE